MFRVFILLLVGVALGLGQALAADPYSGPDFNALVRKADSLTPAESLKAFAVADGFEMELVAVSPDIGQPMNMTFDERGRLWVTSTLEYPYAVPLGQAGRDTIKILEDSNGDGAYDKISLFAGGLNIPTGIYPHMDGVIAWSIPNIWFLRAADGSSITMHSGNSYRVQLDGSSVQQFTFVQVNPFGMCLDSFGNFYTADCHSSPIYQLIRDAYYPSFGKPHPVRFDKVQTKMMER